MDIPTTGDRDVAVAELLRLAKGISVVMVTTMGDEGRFRSRPMLVERIDPDGTIVFLTHLSSHKTHEVSADPRVHVAFVGSDPERYVSVSGSGRVSHDRDMIHGLWNPTYRAWFPDGPDHPDVGVLAVTIDRVEYWDVPSSRLVRLWGVARALATHKPAEAGDHGVVDLPRP
jgi:general stress protein 26